jgi:hypothetical protein
MIDMTSTSPVSGSPVVSEDEAAASAARVIEYVAEEADRDLSRLELAVIKALSFFCKEEWLQEKAWAISTDSPLETMLWLSRLKKQHIKRIAHELGMPLRDFKITLNSLELLQHSRGFY